MISPFLSINCSCHEASRWLNEQLTKAGLRILQTFDLRGAHVGSKDFVCPTHERHPCDCQMAVVLVYGEAPEPVTLILHGNNGQTWLSVAEPAYHKSNLELIRTIQQALNVNTNSA